MTRPPFEYTALRNLNVGPVLGFTAGDPVPASHVKDYGYEIGVDVRPANASELQIVPVTGPLTDDFAEDD